MNPKGAETMTTPAIGTTFWIECMDCGGMGWKSDLSGHSIPSRWMCQACKATGRVMLKVVADPAKDPGTCQCRYEPQGRRGKVVQRPVRDSSSTAECRRRDGILFTRPQPPCGTEEP